MVYIEKTAHGSVRITGMSPIDMYPIGSIYLSTVNTNPATYWGGNWVAWGSGKVPIGVDTGDTDFNTVEKTGGEKKHTLSHAEVPRHNHKQTIGYDGVGGSNSIYMKSSQNATNSAVDNVNGRTVWNPPTPGNGIGRYDYTDWDETRSAAAAHNVVQPYITCYMWKRTA